MQNINQSVAGYTWGLTTPGEKQVSKDRMKRKIYLSHRHNANPRQTNRRRTVNRLLNQIKKSLKKQME